jgi:hypothetical protein
MALISFDQYTQRVGQAFGLARSALAAKDQRISQLEQAVTDAGLPDDQVPPPPVESGDVDGFLSEMEALQPQDVPPGEDVLPDVEELPEPPAEGGGEPAPEGGEPTA